MKRAFDLVGAIVGLLLTLPLMALALVDVRLDSPGPALFRQVRVGRRRQPFVCYKLRSMHVGTAQRATHLVGDDAVTRFGRFARRSKLDEVPQLYNVLKGEMSLVGPRPCLPSQTELVEARDRLGVYEVRPGITGLAQVQGIDMSEPQRLAQVDSGYVRSRTLAGDIRIIIATVLGRRLES
jgi:O-antigen biosynthesis protein WbqP